MADALTREEWAAGQVIDRVSLFQLTEPESPARLKAAGKLARALELYFNERGYYVRFVKETDNGWRTLDGHRL